jgi:hypothetical protein
MEPRSPFITSPSKPIAINPSSLNNYQFDDVYVDVDDDDDEKKDAVQEMQEINNINNINNHGEDDDLNSRVSTLVVGSVPSELAERRRNVRRQGEVNFLERNREVGGTGIHSSSLHRGRRIRQSSTGNMQVDFYNNHHTHNTNRFNTASSSTTTRPTTTARGLDIAMSVPSAPFLTGRNDPASDERYARYVTFWTTFFQLLF